ncbi:hypothetical protein [Actinomadura sp. WMMB 499]|nr:hypothetical protein [Actinomadura sp. WMMB 499]
MADDNPVPSGAAPSLCRILAPLPDGGTAGAIIDALLGGDAPEEDTR